MVKAEITKKPRAIDWNSAEGQKLKEQEGYSPHAEDKFTADEDEFDVFDKDGEPI